MLKASVGIDRMIAAGFIDSSFISAADKDTKIVRPNRNRSENQK